MVSVRGVYKYYSSDHFDILFAREEDDLEVEESALRLGSDDFNHILQLVVTNTMKIVGVHTVGVPPLIERLSDVRYCLIRLFGREGENTRTFSFRIGDPRIGLGLDRRSGDIPEDGVVFRQVELLWYEDEGEGVDNEDRGRE